MLTLRPRAGFRPLKSSAFHGSRRTITPDQRFSGLHDGKYRAIINQVRNFQALKSVYIQQGATLIGPQDRRKIQSVSPTRLGPLLS
jgi:hypothetical protein